MKIRIYSDLHLEFGGFRPPVPENPEDTVLVLAGDIGVKGSAMSFIERESKNYKAIIYVLGNHEYYNGVVPDVLELWRNKTGIIPNLHFLENDSVTIDGIKFCGCTLWTDMNKQDPVVIFKINRVMNDYHVIRSSKASGYGRAHRRKDVFLHPDDTIDMFHKSLAFLESEITEKTVVVTHHAPLLKCIDTSRYGVNDINFAYFTDLSNLILDKKPLMWVSGHTHHSVDFKLGDTRIVSNAKGYTGHDINPLFDPMKEIEI